MRSATHTLGVALTLVVPFTVGGLASSRNDPSVRLKFSFCLLSIDWRELSYCHLYDVDNTSLLYSSVES